MHWQSIGFKGDPLSTDPILENTLPLYTGHENEIDICFNVLNEENRRIVIEGARGVGTTSFANYIRFSLQKKKSFFTPRNELRVEPGWHVETLLSVIIANTIREIELSEKETIIKDKKFQEAKALSNRIAETYRSFGASAFSVGFNYGENIGISQPIIVPAAVLSHHLEDLVELLKADGYKNGLLVQLNNLDIGEIHTESQMKILLNSLRDYTQSKGISWLFVGDVGLRKFIAQHVDRLDDIISYEVKIGSLNENEFKQLIEKRVNFYKTSEKVGLPIDWDVMIYLFRITKGRLRYIFGLLIRLMTMLNLGNLVDRITLDTAKPLVTKLAQDRIKRNEISPAEEEILKHVVQNEEITASKVAKELSKSTQYAGKILKKLNELKLVKGQKQGQQRNYTPSLDAIVAYSSDEK